MNKLEQKKPLWKIIEDLSQMIESSVDPETGEITDEVMTLIEGQELELSDKLDACGGIILHWESYAESLKEQAKSMTQRAKQIEKRAKSFKDYVKYGMKKMDIKKNKGSFQLSILKGRESLVIVDLDKIPGKFKKQVVEWKVDKNEIKKALKDGEEVPGVKLETGQGSLQIK